MRFCFASLLYAFCCFVILSGCVNSRPVRPEYLSWSGKSVVFLGDSITDPIHVGCETNYWGFLSSRMGFDAHVYGRNGWQMSGVVEQLEWARKELGDNVDAIFVFMGTNDFNGNTPRGEWFSECEEKALRSGGEMLLKKREPNCDMKTFKGRLNVALKAIKCTYPRAQVVLLTPIHRGYAKFGPGNIQPDERYANCLGHYISDYVEDVRVAGRIWSVPVIDLFAESGLLPNEKEYGLYMAKPEAIDLLHPSTIGHERLARVIEAHLITLPSTFR